jgi:PadR family transcriptional regulator PadR
MALVKAITKDILVMTPMPTEPSKTPNALLHGALDALLLKTLTRGPRHGYAIARSIEEATGDAVLIEDGSLYPALYRLERKGWVEAEWGTSELGRRAKLYRLTDAGRAQLETELATWKRFSTGISKVLFAS